LATSQSGSCAAVAGDPIQARLARGQLLQVSFNVARGPRQQKIWGCVCGYGYWDEKPGVGCCQEASPSLLQIRSVADAPDQTQQLRWDDCWEGYRKVGFAQLCLGKFCFFRQSSEKVSFAISGFGAAVSRNQIQQKDDQTLVEQSWFQSESAENVLPQP
jgi:hypothetical protein